MTTTIFTMRELEQRSGVQARTLRHWIRKRLLPKPVGRGRGARYTEQHALRANAIRQLRAERASLRSIQAKLSQLSEEQLMALHPPSATSGVATADPVLAAPPAPSYPAQTWEIVTLLDGLVLLVNSQGGPPLRRLADEIYRYYAGAAKR